MKFDEPFRDRQIVFLAMFWSGRGAKSISEIIGAYDWIYKLSISRFELADALNFLLAAGLVEPAGEGFKISDAAHAEFDAYLKKCKKNKFDAVDRFFRKLRPIDTVPAIVEFSEAQYDKHLSEYRKSFRDALAKGRK